VGRSISLPTLIQTDKIEATFRNGELTLVLPKAEEVKPRSIKVKTVK
jgi:HSP20 family protein